MYCATFNTVVMILYSGCFLITTTPQLSTRYACGSRHLWRLTRVRLAERILEYKVLWVALYYSRYRYLLNRVLLIPMFHVTNSIINIIIIIFIVIIITGSISIITIIIIIVLSLSWLSLLLVVVVCDVGVGVGADDGVGFDGVVVVMVSTVLLLVLLFLVVVVLLVLVVLLLLLVVVCWWS